MSVGGYAGDTGAAVRVRRTDTAGTDTAVRARRTDPPVPISPVRIFRYGSPVRIRAPGAGLYRTDLRA
nr:hypothetical protein OH820_16015 [Streptomyces sp. NBC_00857]